MTLIKPVVVVSIPPVPSFEADADAIALRPIDQMTVPHLGELIRRIEQTVCARGTGHVTHDECMALLKCREYLKQCGWVQV